MNLRFLRLAVIGIAVILMGAACAPKATPPVDDLATNIAQGVFVALNSNRPRADAHAVSNPYANTRASHRYPNEGASPAACRCRFCELLVVRAGLFLLFG